MQIRYLEAMQAMAKSGQSKIIFMPGPTNSGDFGLPRAIEENAVAGPSGSSPQSDPMQQVVNARMFEDM